MGNGVEEYVGECELEMDGKPIDADSFGVDEITVGEEYSSMNNNGVIPKRAKYKLTIVAMVNGEESKNYDLSVVKKGSLVQRFDTGKTVTYPNCRCLSAKSSDLDGKTAQKITYVFLAGKPIKG